MAGAAAPKKFDRSLVEGPLAPAVWRLAWPTMLQNLVAGMQGVIHHGLVGHMMGYVANAGIGVAWQIFLVVIVFMASLFTGQAVLVARFAGAGDHQKVNTVVYQAFITAIGMFAVLAPIGYFATPYLLELAKAAPEVQAQAKPFLRINFVFSIGMLLIYMLSAALRAAGDSKTPMRLGVSMTILNVGFNVLLIPKFGTAGSAMGTALAAAIVSGYALWLLFSNKLVVHFTPETCTKPDWTVIRSLFKFGLPTGVQGIAMNVGGVFLLRFIGGLEHSAAAQAAYTISYTELFSMITWTSVGLMGAAATIAGQNLGAGKPDRAYHGVFAAAKIGLTVAATVGAMFLLIPTPLLGIFGASEGQVADIGRELLRYLALSGFFISAALTFTGGLQGTGDTKSPLYITLVSQLVIPLGLCTVLESLRPLQPHDIWLAIVLGHFTRCALSFLRFRQGKWRAIKVDLGPARPAPAS